MEWETLRAYAVLLVPLFLLWLVLLVAALRDLIPRRPDELAGGNKALWYGIVIGDVWADHLFRFRPPQGRLDCACRRNLRAHQALP